MLLTSKIVNSCQEDQRPSLKDNHTANKFFLVRVFLRWLLGLRCIFRRLRGESARHSRAVESRIQQYSSTLSIFYRPDHATHACPPQNIGLFASADSSPPPNDGESSPEIQKPEPRQDQDYSQNSEFQKTELSPCGESLYQDEARPDSPVCQAPHEQNRRPNVSPTGGESQQLPFFINWRSC